MIWSGTVVTKAVPAYAVIIGSPTKLYIILRMNND